jgi:hypothetical protein
MAGQQTNLGEAIITVKVDDSGVGPGIATSVQKAQAQASSIAGPGGIDGAGGQSMDAQTAKIETQTRAVDKLGSSMLGLRQAFSIGAVAATGLFVAASKLSDIFINLAKGTKQANDEFVRGISSQNTMAERISSLSAASQDLTNKFSRLNENSNIYSSMMSRISLAWTEGIYTSGQLSERIQAVNKELEESQRIKKQAEIDAAEEKKKADQQAKYEDLEQGMAERRALRIAEEGEQEELDRKAAEHKEYLDAEVAAKKREAAEEQYERDLKQAEAVGAAVEKAFERAIQNTRDRSASLLNVGEITNSIELIGQKLDAIARNTRSRM